MLTAPTKRGSSMFDLECAARFAPLAEFARRSILQVGVASFLAAAMLGASIAEARTTRIQILSRTTAFGHSKLASARSAVGSIFSRRSHLIDARGPASTGRRHPMSRLPVPQLLTRFKQEQPVRIAHSGFTGIQQLVLGRPGHPHSRGEPGAGTHPTGTRDQGDRCGVQHTCRSRGPAWLGPIC